MKKKLEKIVLKQVEKLSRKNAGTSRAYPDLPECTFFMHQPKRPKHQ
jgi:cyclic lactone autoinducer peptide